MEKYVLGVDGGGTKTEVILVNRTGTIIARTRGGSTNYQAVGGERLKLELSNLIEKITSKTKIPTNKIYCLFLGLAGAGRKSDRQAIAKLFDDSDFKDKISVDSDAIIALAGAFSNRHGIILIAGTGAICFGKNAENKVVRAGGWGYLLGDEGSGYFIGRNAIQAALKDFDGRGEKTLLRNVLESKFNLNSIDEIVPLIYRNKLDRVAIADLAPLVFDQAKEGEPVAQQIIKETGSEMGKLAKAVAVRLGFTNEKVNVALIGSIFKQRDMLINEINKELFEVSWDIEITEPDFDPTIGAAILALEKGGVCVDEHILANLKNSTEVFIE